MASPSGGERVLVNFFYAHPVGHAIEALHYCLAHAANPEAAISVALNAATAVELAGFCPFVSHAYAVEQRAPAGRPRAHDGCRFVPSSPTPSATRASRSSNPPRSSMTTARGRRA
jgi:hypothetical protein